MKKFTPRWKRLGGFLVILGLTAMDLIGSYQQEDEIEELKKKVADLEKGEKIEEENH